MTDRGVYNRKFRALSNLDVPAFITSISRMLGAKGHLVREWAESMSPEQLSVEIKNILASPQVLDEWQFLFMIQHRGAGPEGTSDFTVTEMKSDQVHDYEVLRCPVIIGDKVKELIDHLVSSLCTAVVTDTPVVYIVTGPASSGKSFILDAVTAIIRDRLGITPSRVRNITRPSPIQEAVICIDDMDIECPRRELLEQFVLNMKLKPKAVLITCRDSSKLGPLVDACDAVVKAIPRPTLEDMIQIVSDHQCGWYTITPGVASQVCRLVLSTNQLSPLRKAFDAVARLVYPFLEEDYVTGVAKPTELDFSPEQVREAVAMVCEVPLSGTREAGNLREKIRERLKGQDAVVDAILPMLNVIHSGMSNPSKVAGAILCYGPTGTGKTFLGHVIADILFGGVLHKEDMNTYHDRFSVTRLTGAPPGYIGYDDTTALLSFIDNNRRGVIVLDEIEKADQKVLDHIMEYLDTGFIVDSKGKKHDGRGFVVLMTSNITFGVTHTTGQIGFHDETESVEPGARQEILETKEFKPEFVNRIDYILKYQSVDPAVLDDIALSLLENLRVRTLSVGIDFDPEQYVSRVVDAYTEDGGARTMRVFVETIVNNEVIRGAVQE